MPIHDWTRVDAGIFHHFHQHWSMTLCRALNEGTLPPEYFALVEQNMRGPIADVLTLHLPPDVEVPKGESTALAVAEKPPQTRIVSHSDHSRYAELSNIVAIHHRHGDVVAVIEIISPGNKSSRDALAAFVRKSAELLRHEVNLLVIDLFPPSPRDPQGIHKAIWDMFEEEELDWPADKPLTLASYDATGGLTAYVEPVAVRDSLPEMPIFLRSGQYVLAPLESTYQAAWDMVPTPLKGLFDQSTESSA